VKTQRFFLSLVVLALVPSLAWSDPVTRTDVERVMSGFEHSSDLATIRAWGAPGAHILSDITNDTQLPPVTRARAAHALRAFRGDATVQTFLRSVAASRDVNLFVMRSCFDALIDGFDDVTEVSRYLSDTRSDVRDGAAWSLAASRLPQARAALQDRLRVETDEVVRETITRALATPAVAPIAPVVINSAPSVSFTVPTVNRRRIVRARNR
jgi:hypothetical protein